MHKKARLLLLFLVGVITMLLTSWTWSEQTSEQTAHRENLHTAIFAGGCFWCMEPPFDKLDGVVSTISGYTGGHTKNPTYEQVSKENTGHFEAVEVTYDPAKINYQTLLNVFWHNIDPLNPNGQFCDHGDSYRTAIFYQNEEQRKLAEASLKELGASNYLKAPIVTQILPAKTYYPAEDYHQDYYKKNPLRYKYYRFACARDRRLIDLWGHSAGQGGILIPETHSQDNK